MSIGKIAQFPDVGDNRYLNLRRAEGEALWRLGRQSEAEAVYRALVEKQPDEAWAYIGWSDEYYEGFTVDQPFILIFEFELDASR
jgi:hypothetical protein